MKAKEERFTFWVLIPSWTTLKSMGELRVINNISYGSLLVVPALAAVWPGIRFLFSQIELDVPFLPLALVSAFFAALAVALAQIVYQVQCPRIVKLHDQIGYVVEQIAIQNSLKSKDALESYVGEVLKAVRKVNPAGAPLHRHELVWGPIVEIQNLHRMTALGADERLDIIRRVARLEFIAAACCRPAARLFATFLYLLSISLLIFVVIRQVYFVAIEGGVLLWLTS